MQYAKTFRVMFILALGLTAQLAWAQIVQVGHLEPSTTTQYGDVWGAGDYAYLGTRAGQGVFIIDIRDPANPFVASQYLPTAGSSPQDVKVDNGIGYFATNNGGGIDIVDLSDPTQPQFLSHIPGQTHNLFVSNNVLYTNDKRVYDVSDPANPVFWYDLGNRAHDVTVVGDRLYESNFSTGTLIYDLSNISATNPPPLLARVPTGSSSHSGWSAQNGDIWVNAREVGNGDIGVFDFSDLNNPQLLSRVFDDDFGADAFSPHNPLIVGDHVYVSWYESGLQVFDISDPVTPVHLGRFDTSRNWGVYPFLGNDRILLSDMNDGLFIVDVTNILDGPQGDFNDDGSFDCADIDQLTGALASKSTDLAFDMTGDGVLDADDVDAWLRVAGTVNLPRHEPSLRFTRYVAGDANLDGVVDGADFLRFNTHLFESKSGWCDGDFNGDGAVDPQDFMIWFENRFAPSTPRLVPEPHFGMAWLVVGWLVGYRLKTEGTRL